MPIFDYVCHKCGYTLMDVLVGKRAPQPCPNCEQEMQKMPSAPSFTIKGFTEANGYAQKQS